MKFIQGFFLSIFRSIEREETPIALVNSAMVIFSLSFIMLRIFSDTSPTFFPALS